MHTSLTYKILQGSSGKTFDLNVNNASEILKEIQRLSEEGRIPPYTRELFILEDKLLGLEDRVVRIPEVYEGYWLNPSIFLLEVDWSGLTHIIKNKTGEPVKGKTYILGWKTPDGAVQMEEGREDLILALKIASEAHDLKGLSLETGKSISFFNSVLYKAERVGLIKRPLSNLVRRFGKNEIFKTDEFFTTETFTLQWHITQACDLHCKHCYDRSIRKSVSMDEALWILDDLYDFCSVKGVRGQVSFSGGNPFLHPHFFDIYKEAVDRGFIVAVLGNPVSEGDLKKLVSIKKPAFFQVSLEGLQKKNDWVRGEGHFERTIGFLSLLNKYGIYRMVMLTLTADNMNEVIPLAEKLEGIVDTFTFNRLSLVGEGEKLSLPKREDFNKFLKEYFDLSKKNDYMTLKDNFFNIIRYKSGFPPGGGCTGFGCGAAFNFVSLLPDGEVHACRKFPSKIGKIKERSLLEIYDSPLAERYREGPSACLDCKLRP
ncbi:MAG: selenobiotic family peptide radical SAM maturase, partial [Nitrospirae bacterium]